MKRLTWLDGVGTALVAAVAGVYAAFQAAGDVPTRGVALIGLVLGVTAYLAMGPVARAPQRLVTFGKVLAVASLGLGTATVVTGAGVLLDAFIGSVAALWAVAMVSHALGLAAPPSDGQPPPDDDMWARPDDRPPAWDPDRPSPSPGVQPAELPNIPGGWV